MDYPHNAYLHKSKKAVRMHLLKLPHGWVRLPQSCLQGYSEASPGVRCSGLGYPIQEIPADAGASAKLCGHAG